MEMAKPEKESSTAPAFAMTPAPQLSSVEDLERRLKLIGNSPEPVAEAPAATMKPAPKPAPEPAAAAAAAAATATSTAAMSGKTALLARIMAAKEKTQKASQGGSAQKAPPAKAAVMAPPPATDLLSDFDAPGQAHDPPPAYETNFLPPPPPMEAPSSGNSTTNFMDDFLPPPPPMEDNNSYGMQFDPPPPLNNSVAGAAPPQAPPAFMAPPAASAPMFEDLHQHSLPPPPPDHNGGGEMNLLDMPSAMPPPMSMAMPPPPAPDIDEDILAALDPAEREAILEEQRKIMEQIENEKVNNDASSAAARAMAFDQRSSSAVAKVAGQYETSSRSTKSKSSSSSSSSKAKAPPSYAASSSSGTIDLGHGEQVPLHGKEKTQKAISEGNALIVQCLNCHNWMQVTKDATLMFCPTCQVVSPVLADEAATSEDLEDAARLSADAQLAEKLQAEEYARAGGGGGAAAAKKTSSSSSNKKTAKLEKGQAVEQSWYDWFMGSSEEADTKPPPPARGSAELRPRGLVAASTGEESYGRGSYDESERLTGGGARMAESKGMFACVADAVGTAVNSMAQDDEGNVHGVDASGLLAMPNVTRQRD